eukprot:Clim_evm105s172 gene=Clim_evmTU105s172
MIPQHDAVEESRVQKQVPRDINNSETGEETSKACAKTNSQSVNESSESLSHLLETPWTVWLDHRLSKHSLIDYKDAVKKLCTFGTVEEFWKVYVWLKPADEIACNMNVHIFRDGVSPMWESFPHGGCWILTFNKKDENVARYWERLVFATVGENFEDPNVVGIVCSRRHKENMLSIWNKTNADPSARFRIKEKLLEVLHLDESAHLQYKFHSMSIRDGSTYHHTNAMESIEAAKKKSTAHHQRSPNASSHATRGNGNKPQQSTKSVSRGQRSSSRPGTNRHSQSRGRQESHSQGDTGHQSTTKPNQPQRASSAEPSAERWMQEGA